MIELPYNYLPNNFRVIELPHKLIRYPELPKKSLNFDIFPLFAQKSTTQQTLENLIVTKHFRTIEDCIITEIWLAESLSIRSAFFYELYDAITYAKASNEKILWSPKDRCKYTFNIEFISLSAGDEDNYDINPIHSRYTEKDYRWLRSEIQLKFKIIGLFNAPNAVVSLGEL